VKIHRAFFKPKTGGEIVRTRLDKKGGRHYYLSDAKHTLISRYKLHKHYITVPVLLIETK